jgi:transcriptional regulator with XRE-family HTH domain
MTYKRPRIPHYDDPVAVGHRLHEAREAAGLSQRELAFPGCSAAYISRIERGERIPSLQVMRELARRTGVSEAFLARGRETLDNEVARRVREAEKAEADGDAKARSQAYAALATAATRAALTRTRR